MKTDLFAPPSSRARARPFEWVIEPLTSEPSFLVRPMFGSHACYLRGRLVIVLCGRHEEPWHGVLVPTAREHHASLQREFPALAPHDVLGKWLYLAARRDEFEDTAQALVEHVCRDDGRIGIEPRAAKKRRARKPKSSSPRRA